MNFCEIPKNISSKIFIDFFSNNFSPVKICRLVQEKNCLFSTSKNLWIFLDLNFLTIFTQKMYLHAKRIFKVRKKNIMEKNLLKNWEMSKNSKKLCHEKKNYHPKFLDFFAIFWWIFSLPNFCICMPKKKKWAIEKCVSKFKNRGVQCWAELMCKTPKKTDIQHINN